MNFNEAKQELSRIAEKLNFNRDTLEKVYRLISILKFINTEPNIKNSLALKGGTAINLLFLKLPRLSTDIDLDFTEICKSPEEVNKKRQFLKQCLNKYMKKESYTEDLAHSKNPFSLSSTFYKYTNLSNIPDRIKVEINFSMRSHIITPGLMPVTELPGKKPLFIRSLSKFDIFAAKINALLSRKAIRDLYDLNNAIENDIFKPNDYNLLKKATVFYSSISQKNISENFNINAINDFRLIDVKKELLPVIEKGEYVELEKMKSNTINFLSNLLVLNHVEKEYLKQFNEKKYMPELLFDDEKILNNIKKHPMAIWKTQVEHSIKEKKYIPPEH